MSNAARSVGLALGLCILHSIGLIGAPVASAHSKIPARTVIGYLMIIPVRINGQGPFDFMVDTGTNTTLIETTLAEQLGLKAVDQISLVTVTGTEAASRYFLGSATVGSESVANLEVLSQQMQVLHAVDPRVRGVLGSNFLLHFSILLDYSHHRIELYKLAESPDFAGGTRVPAQIAEGRIVISAESEASSSGGWRLALDSGASRLLVFKNRIAATRNGSRGGGSTIQLNTNLSSRSTSTVTLRNFVIADLHFRNMPLVVLHGDAAVSDPFEDGILPTSLFRSVFINAREGFVVFSLH